MNQIDIPIKIPDTIKFADFDLQLQETKEHHQLIFRHEVIAAILGNSGIDLQNYPELVHSYIKMAIIGSAYMEHLKNGGIQNKAGELVLFTLHADFGEVPQTLN